MPQLTLSRRHLLAVAVAAAAALSGRLGVAPARAQDGADEADEAANVALGEAEPFSPEMVRERARVLAEAAFEAPPEDIPAELADLSYEGYRRIEHVRDSALWRDEGLHYQLETFIRGHVYRTPVALNAVAEGQSRPILYTPDLFDFADLEDAAAVAGDVGFSGFRLRAPLNRVDQSDAVAAFQGASYFQAVGAGQVFGLSARGLAISTAEPEGEEIPMFREFWIERPGPAPSPIAVHALLDSPSATAAYRFTIRPGAITSMDIEVALFARVDISRVGLAPVTSMFYFSPQDRVGIDDFRPAVHNSEGLLMWNGNGEWLWRPLVNPGSLQISAFVDGRPQGFGLMQRERRFDDYQDLGARYDRRPSLWVEPVGDWGAGAVVLVEIPSDSQMHDNITCFWRPQSALAVGGEHTFAYRLHWGDRHPVENGLARIQRTMIGNGSLPGSEEERPSRLIVLDYVGGLFSEDPSGDGVGAELFASEGTFTAPHIRHNPETGGCRVSFEYVPKDATTADLRCELVRGGETLAEVWVFRWST